MGCLVSMSEHEQLIYSVAPAVLSRWPHRGFIMSLAETKATMAANYVTRQSPASRELAAQSASPPGPAVEGAAGIGQQQTSPVKSPGLLPHAPRSFPDL